MNYDNRPAKSDDKTAEDSSVGKKPTPRVADASAKRKLTFKEKREFEQLEKEIASLEAEKKQIETELCSGTLSIDELTTKSKRLPELNDELDEKSMRWLELAEIEN
jgi:ATP-binding cassette subfamily F protein uup